MNDSLSRRGFLKVTAAGAVVPAFHVPPRRRATRPVAISSGNGLRSIEIAVERMSKGESPVDAAVFGIEPVENDPDDTSVGYGGLPNEDGVVELDSCVMDGPTGLAGAVASLRNIKNPSQVALRVMRETDHVLLVGEGALRFARAHGFPEENLLTERARKWWLNRKQRASSDDDWVLPDENKVEEREKPPPPQPRDSGTIHVGCVNEHGDIGGCTSTSGLSFKIPGRVGDSPLIGCGNYVDNDFGVAGSTGRGEAVIITNGASFIVHEMATGKTPTDACLSACKRIARMTKIDRLLVKPGQPNFRVNFYAINKKGEFGAASMYPSHFVAMTENGPQKRATAYLFDNV